MSFINEDKAMDTTRQMDAGMSLNKEMYPEQRQQPQAEELKSIAQRVERLETVISDAKVGMPHIDEHTLFDDYDICTYLGIASSTWRAKRRGLQIRYTDIGNKKYITYTELKRLIEEKTVKITRDQVDALIGGKADYYRRRCRERASLVGEHTFSSLYGANYGKE